MKKRDPLKHLRRIAYDVLIAIIGSLALHGIKLSPPIIVFWLSLLFGGGITPEIPSYGIHMAVQNIDVSDTG